MATKFTVTNYAAHMDTRAHTHTDNDIKGETDSNEMDLEDEVNSINMSIDDENTVEQEMEENAENETEDESDTAHDNENEQRK